MIRFALQTDIPGTNQDKKQTGCQVDFKVLIKYNNQSHINRLNVMNNKQQINKKIIIKKQNLEENCHFQLNLNEGIQWPIKQSDVTSL